MPQEGSSVFHFVTFIEFYVIPTSGLLYQGGKGDNKGVGNTCLLSVIHSVSLCFMERDYRLVEKQLCGEAITK